MSGATGPGRSCPMAYRCDPAMLAGPASIVANTLYVVGGVYGNPFALGALLELADSEPGGASVAFNGDFNWFNVEPRDFQSINELVLQHAALRGNVETEIARSSQAAGCGCAYPEWVSDAEVERSNRIMSRLQETASPYAQIRSALAALPMVLKAEVGGLPVGIVHGDASSLAGWDFSQESLRADSAAAIRQVSLCGVRVMASSHTCLPVAEVFDLPHGRCALFNNGAAGMPNFKRTNHGLATRISVRPAIDSVYGVVIGRVHVDAVPIRYDGKAWLEHFDRVWPGGSPAALAYRHRLVTGPAYAPDQATRRGIEPRLCAGAKALPRQAMVQSDD